MRKRKNTGKLLSILLCLMMVLGMLPITAQAEEWGRVPGSSNTNTFEEADTKTDPSNGTEGSGASADNSGTITEKTFRREISVVKHVQQTGTETPPAATFEFELEDTAQGEKHPLSYYGIGVAELKLSTNGVGDVEKTFSFDVPWTNDYAVYHWDAVPKSGTNTVAWYSKTFLLREKNDGKPGWNYSNEEYTLTFWYDGSMDLKIHDPENDVDHEKAEFTNTYNATRYELPFTKTVKLGGNAAPGRETFELEIFDVGVRSMEEQAKDLYTATVTTNGAGVYESALVISGPADQVRELVCEGFYVREKNAGTANWSYSDEVWFVSREQVPSVPGDGTVILPDGFPGNITPTNPEREYTLVIYPTTAEPGDNGIHYTPKENSVEKMTFTNTYTRSTSGGGGGGSTGATVTAKKTDAQGKALAGATFVLEDSRGREAYQATSNTSGTVRFTDVSSGTYTLLEKKAPEGYVLSNETYTLTVSGSRVTMNGKSYSPVTFVNRKAAELNRTDHFAFLVGYTDGTFGPERNMTRAEVTTMFARLLTEQIEADKTYSNTFSDVPKGYWAANYIGYMQQFGIITGYSDGNFRPDAPVTRAEFAAIASRFEKLTEGSKSFTDVPDTYWAARYINFAATRGWVTGYSDGTFKPENPITRAEVAAVTCRLLERSADQTYIRSHIGELRTFADVTESHWAYWYAMEAANGHDYTKSGGSENWNRTYR